MPSKFNLFYNLKHHHCHTHNRCRRSVQSKGLTVNKSMEDATCQTDDFKHNHVESIEFVNCSIEKLL